MISRRNLILGAGVLALVPVIASSEEVKYVLRAWLTYYNGSGQLIGAKQSPAKWHVTKQYTANGITVQFGRELYGYYSENSWALSMVGKDERMEKQLNRGVENIIRVEEAKFWGNWDNDINPFTSWWRLAPQIEVVGDNIHVLA